MKTCPGTRGAPSTASDTAGAQVRFSRSARLRVKSGGICCTIIVAGQLAGKDARTVESASTPPVEEPMTTTCALGA